MAEDWSPVHVKVIAGPTRALKRCCKVGSEGTEKTHCTEIQQVCRGDMKGEL